MATKNDITGDSLISRGSNKAYLDNYDLIFRKGNPKEEEEGFSQRNISFNQNRALAKSLRA